MSPQTVTLEGASDDLIEISGDIVEEFNLKDNEFGDLIAFSNGALLKIVFDPDGTGNWRILPIARGNGTLHIEQAEGEDDTDKATITGDIVWVVQGVARATRGNTAKTEG